MKEQSEPIEQAEDLEITVTIKQKISHQRLRDLFCSALEGGSNYWYCEIEPMNKAQLKTYDDLDFFYQSLITHGFTIKDNESEEQFTVKPEQITEALVLMAEKYSKHFSDFINENDDAETGDVFLQLCCFKKIVYG